MAGVADRIYTLIQSTVEGLGVTLWDVRFVKEGASHYLRIYIDRPEGVSIDDCTAVSHAVDPVIDEADPIDCSYYLEVCSPGIERELTRDFHYARAVGSRVRLRLFRAVDGKREFTGILKAWGKEVLLDDGSGVRVFAPAEISKATMTDDRTEID